MVNQSLKNKRIIISAGASGIGLATAKVCLARGAYVYLCDIDSKFLNKLNKHPLKNKKLFAYLKDKRLLIIVMLLMNIKFLIFLKKLKRKLKKLML